MLIYRNNSPKLHHYQNFFFFFCGFSDLVCEDAKRIKANAILFHCVINLCCLVINSVVVVILGIGLFAQHKSNCCAGSDVDTSTPVENVENPRQLAGYNQMA